ncbi:MAG: hypothetical protein CMA63_03365 [Euryarchaeota archaeon]|nr:hypothetical protein [Euryarchaeota archaeon]
MRKGFILVGLLILTAFCPVTSVALPATTLEGGVVFGGQWSEANVTDSSVENLSDLPSIVEILTATWCGNCVTVEHAFEEVSENVSIQQYHVHRAINEPSDPLGSEAVNQRFYDRYGVVYTYEDNNYNMYPPASAINGTTFKYGSVTDYDSLTAEFTDLVQEPLQLGNGTSVFSWTPTSNTTGTVAWALDIDLAQFGEGVLTVNAWVVEHSANFEEGTNGLGDYPHVVRGIVELGKSLTGTSTITLPPAYDGNDLSVHLVYEVNMPVVEDPPAESEEEERALPAASLLATGTVLLVAAARRESDTRNE